MIKIFLRNIKKNLIAFLGITFVLMVSFFVFNGFYNTAYLLETNVEEFKVISNQEDFVIKTIINLEEEDINQLESKYKIEINEVNTKKYLGYDETGKLSADYEIIKYDPEMTINVPYIVKGEYPLQKNEVLISETFAEANQIFIGDTLLINDKEYIVSGTAYFPDYITPIGQGNGLISDSLIFSVVYMNEESYEELEIENKTDYSGTFNNPTLAENQRESVYDNIKKDYTIKLPKYDSNRELIVDENGNFELIDVPQIYYIQDAESNASISTIDSEIISLKSMSFAISLFLILITTLIFIVLIKKIIQKQRKEIGILKSLGYSNRKIKNMYLLYPILFIIIAIIFGVIFGFFMSLNFYDLYITTAYFIPTFEKVTISLDRIIISVIIGIIIIFIIYIYAIRAIVETKTLFLLKGIDSVNSVKEYNKIKKTIKNRSYNFRYSIMNLIRSWFSVIIIIIATLISTTFILILGSIIGAFSSLNKLYIDTYQYDYEAYYYLPQNESTKNTQEEFIQYSYNIARIDYVDETKTQPEEFLLPLIVTGIDPTLDTINLQDKKGNDINYLMYEGIVVTDYLASKYNLEVGDVIVIEYNENNNIIEYELEVSAISNIQVYPYAYISKDLMIEIFSLNPDEYTGIFGEGEIPEVANEVGYVFDVESMVTKISNALIVMKKFMGIFGAVLMSIVMIVIVILTRLIIDDKTKEISIMKVMGYDNKRINSLIIKPYTYVVLISVTASLPIAYFITSQFMKILEEAMGGFSMPISIGIGNIIYVYVIIVGIYKLGMFFNKKKINNISLAESLKNDE